MTTHTLTTKTFGKQAQKEVFEIVGQKYSVKRHSEIINIYSATGKKLGYVSTSSLFGNAELRVG
jgi:hypothetical protein